jgi:hypothetical protein
VDKRRRKMAKEEAREEAPADIKIKGASVSPAVIYEKGGR